MSGDGFLQLRGVASRYGQTRVLKDIDLSIGKGEFVALLGSSGCGKTTLLRVIAGFIEPSDGQVTVDGRDITRHQPDKRGMALVFQSYALWPHMTVAQNIGYGLKLRGISREEITRRVLEMAAMLGLAGLEERKPANLSGGQRQRVALGRALAIDPEILLLDEPLSNLDARIRLSVRHELRALQKRLGITAVHVTHDREEAMVMADRIVILDGGRIAQQGSPEEVYNRPASSFVAAFMGAENLLELDGVRDGEIFVLQPGAAGEGGSVPVAGRALESGAVEARFRPEAARLTDIDAAASQPGVRFFGEVMSVSYPGGHWRHAVKVGGREIMADADRAFTPGQPVAVFVPAETLFLFNTPSGAPVSRPGLLPEAVKIPA
ncbi:ATP-binding cassette domain-containing protein [Rhizobiales bacterium RZME27]|uniref:ATP-binding cassette domain-containing protein n=1 Tax=Endobacterium cereale TaxID=2663029 RepID=A0A6A8A749_9HYPH|nr:ABC transporter ATP-binding protein [Endobacterium cereale]MEB2843171.1 ABC transporter ATP-binding protein [Endobacterium cereale]MQY47132.1 ATP-binding cassette domain-containing protein [Endobacterium cereale]